MADDESPQPPRLKPVEPTGLTPGDPRQVLDGDTCQRARFCDADFGRRDLSHTTFSECELVRVSFDDTDLRSAHITASRLVDVDAPVLRAPRLDCRGSVLTRSRIGSAELYDSVWSRVLVAESKLGYLNARSATWTDVRFTDCVLTELDLVDARLHRVAFDGCRIGTLTLTGARLVDVDLRRTELATIDGIAGLGGSTITPTQLDLLAPLLARHLGISVREQEPAVR